MENAISNIDITVILVYFIIIFAIGIYVSRLTKTSDDLFLGGRSLTWGFIGLSLFASNISTSTIMGLSGSAYTSGIVGSVYEWMTGIPLIIASLIFIPIYLKSKITTIPEFLLHRYDRRSQVFFSVVTIFASIMVETAGGLYAGALVMKVFFPDLSIWHITFSLAFVAGLYTVFGGLKAVVFTDALQAIVLIVGCFTLTYFMFEKFDFSWSNVVGSVKDGHFSVVRPLSDNTLPWPGLLLGVQLMGFWYWTTNQYIVQRVLGAKSIQHARWGAMLAGFLKIIPLFIIVVPGVMAISIFPGLEKGDMVFPTMVTNVLPVGMVGLVLAGLVSAIMSSVDSTLNSASTLIVIDFIKPMNKNITDKKVLKYGRVTTVVLMIIAAVWAPMIVNFGGIWDYLQQMYAIFVPPVVVLFLVGVFYKRGNADGAFWTLIVGVALGLSFFILKLNHFAIPHFTMSVGIVIAISAVVFILVSNATKAPDLEVIEKYTFKKDLIDADNENAPWYANYKYHAALLFLTILVILYFLS